MKNSLAYEYIDIYSIYVYIDILNIGPPELKAISFA